MDETPADLAIVSMHEKGFPMGDLYLGQGRVDATVFNNMGLSPDSWFSLKRGDTLEMAADHARAIWPNALVVPARVDDDETEED